MGGIGMIPLMIGMFAISEIIRYAVDTNPPPMIVDQPIGNVFKGMWRLTVKYPKQILRGSALGTLVGALPGAGADIAAWMSYAISKKFSKEPEKFGTGHVEGIVESGAANNSALAGAWIPALVFGIPGDSITAIVIGVLYMKNMNPGPALFVNNPQNIYAVFLLFIIANLIMIPLGYACIKALEADPQGAAQRADADDHAVLRRRRVRDQQHGVRRRRDADRRRRRLSCSRRTAFPIAPAILGVVLGGMLEDNFVTSMIKSDGNLLAFFASSRGGHARRDDARGVVPADPDAPAAAARGRVNRAVHVLHPARTDHVTRASDPEQPPPGRRCTRNLSVPSRRENLQF